MSSITYGGVKYIQTRHAIYCKKCKTTAESKFIHDLKYCSCGSIGVDGGISAGNRIVGKQEDIEIRSIYCAYVKGKSLWLPHYVLEEHFQNWLNVTS